MKKMKLILNESLISNKDSDIIEDTTVAQKPDYQIIDITVIPDETYYPTIQSILIDLDENDKLKESAGNRLDINILSETVNQKTGYSNSLFEFESSNHTITLSLVLQETDRRGIYKVEAYTTRGIKVFESNTYRPKYVVESYLNSLANEYLIDKPLKESARIYDDEKDYSGELGEVFNLVAEFINSNFTEDPNEYLEHKYSDDTYWRLDKNKVLDGIIRLVNNSNYDIHIDKNRVSHAHNIGNNNAYEIFKGDECIGFLSVNSGIYAGEIYIYLEDLSGNRFGGSWELRPGTEWNWKRNAVVKFKNDKGGLKESDLKVGDEIEFYSTGYKPNGKFSNKPDVLMKTTITKINPDGSVSAKDPQGVKSFDYITPEEIISVNGKKIKESEERNPFGSGIEIVKVIDFPNGKGYIGYDPEHWGYHSAYWANGENTWSTSSGPFRTAAEAEQDLRNDFASMPEAEILNNNREDDNLPAEDPAPKSDPDDYTVEEFMTAQNLADQVLNLNIDYSEWNDASQEEREEMVKPELTKFLNSHKNMFDKDPKVFDLMQYDLIDLNFHTEAKVLKELYRGGNI